MLDFRSNFKKLLFKFKILTEACLFYSYNHFVTNLPIYYFRHIYLKKLLKIKIGNSTAIHMGCFFTGKNIEIGNNCVVNRKTHLDGRHGIKIGNNVSISPECYLLSLTHNVNDKNFNTIGKQVVIDDYSWIGVRVIILPGVYLAKGTVVGAGSVVTKSVNNKNYIVGGIPSKFIAERKISNYEFELKYFPYFDTDITR